jgi:hypothetical protein
VLSKYGVLIIGGGGDILYTRGLVQYMHKAWGKLKKSTKLQTLSEQGTGLTADPLCLTFYLDIGRKKIVFVKRF